MTTLGSLTDPRGTEDVHIEPLDMNPFVADDILSGAQVVEIRFDAIRSVLSVVLELRVSDGDWQACAGLLTAQEVQDYSWSQTDRGDIETAWTISSSRTRATGGKLALHVSGDPSFSLDVAARRSRFFTGRIERLEGTAPPDYGEIVASSRHPDIPNWDSRVTEIRAVYHP